MSEHNNNPLQSEQSPVPGGLAQVDLANLYILGDPRGVAALPENVEYDIREIPLTVEDQITD